MRQLVHGNFSDPELMTAEQIVEALRHWPTESQCHAAAALIERLLARDDRQEPTP